MVAFDHPQAVTPFHRLDQGNSLGEIGQFIVDQVTGHQNQIGPECVGGVDHLLQHPAGGQAAHVDVRHVRAMVIPSSARGRVGSESVNRRTRKWLSCASATPVKPTENKGGDSAAQVPMNSRRVCEFALARAAAG